MSSALSYLLGEQACFLHIISLLDNALAPFSKLASLVHENSSVRVDQLLRVEKRAKMC